MDCPICGRFIFGESGKKRCIFCDYRQDGGWRKVDNPCFNCSVGLYGNCNAVSCKYRNESFAGLVEEPMIWVNHKL